MDLEKFINEKPEPHDKIGVYCIQPSNLEPPWNRGYVRCGAAGTRELADVVERVSGAQSTLRTRCALYLTTWIGGGVIHLFLTVPRSIFYGWSRRVLAQRGDRDGREDYAMPGNTLLQVREKQYHALLSKRGVARVRGGRAEWFRGSLRGIEAAMRSIGTGTLYKFDANGVASKETLVKHANDSDLNVVEHAHRRSPRLEEVVTVRPAKRASARLREALTNPKVAAQIAEVATRSPEIQKIRLTRKDLGPPSRRLRTRV